MKEIVFLGSKAIGAECLQYLLANQDKLNAKVIAVKTIERKELEDNISVSSLAIKQQIPILKSLNELPECDIIYSVQHNEILHQSHIDKAREIAVNLHLAPLPEYRGCNQFSFAIMDEATEFGVTIHQIDSKIDHGKILFEDRFSIKKDIWVKELFDLANEKGIALFEKTIADIINENYTLKSFNPTAKSSLHYRNEINQLKEISPNLPQEEIAKRIRATAMPGFEPPFYWKEGKKVYWEI